MNYTSWECPHCGRHYYDEELAQLGQPPVCPSDDCPSRNSEPVQAYTFDVKLFASITIKATSEAEARAWIKNTIDGAEANLGCYPNGDPIVTTVSRDDGDDELIEIDGEWIA